MTEPPDGTPDGTPGMLGTPGIPGTPDTPFIPGTPGYRPPTPKYDAAAAPKGKLVGAWRWLYSMANFWKSIRFKFKLFVRRVRWFLLM